MKGSGSDDRRKRVEIKGYHREENELAGYLFE